MIAPGVAGLLRVTEYDLKALVPQAFEAETVIVPLLVNPASKATWIELVPAPELIIAPAGTVQL